MTTLRRVVRAVLLLLALTLGSSDAFTPGKRTAGRRLAVGLSLSDQKQSQQADLSKQISVFDQVIINVLSCLPQVLAVPKEPDLEKMVKNPPRYNKAKDAEGWRVSSLVSKGHGFREMDAAQGILDKFGGWSPTQVEGKIAKLHDLLNELHTSELLDIVDNILDEGGKGETGVEQTDADEEDILESLDEYAAKGKDGIVIGGSNHPFKNKNEEAAFEAESHLHSSSANAMEPFSERPVFFSETDGIKRLPVGAIESAERFIVEGLEQSFAPLDAKISPLKLLERRAIPFSQPVKLSALRKVLQRNPNHYK